MVALLFPVLSLLPTVLSQLVVTPLGSIRGVSVGSAGQEQFLGIRYAEPAVRFSNPEAITTPWLLPKDATAYGFSCPQYGPLAVGKADVPFQNEDCLTLNIGRPTGVSALTKKVPVVVYLVGGAYISGTSTTPLYEMTNLVQKSKDLDKPIIVVTLNYRVSAFGFLASKEVLAAGVANIGLKDQRLALKWVKANIASFGGDPDKITLWGHSAGAFSAGLQILAYGGTERGLFKAAILESGTARATYQPLSQYQALYDSYVVNTGCSGQADTLKCLRTAPFDLIYGNNPVFWAPIVDGDFVKKAPSISLANGEFDKSLPILLGDTTAEGTFPFFGGNWKGVNSNDDLRALLTTPSRNGGFPITPQTADALLAAYTEANSPIAGVAFDEAYHGSEYRRASAIAGDIFITAQRRYQARTSSQFGAKVYSYRFDTPMFRLPAAVTQGIADVPTHVSDLMYFWSNTKDMTDPYEVYIGPDSRDLALSDLMSRALISFVNFGTPQNHGVPGVPVWPVYNSRAGGVNMVFRAKSPSVLETDNYRSTGIDIIINNPSQFLH